MGKEVLSVPEESLFDVARVIRAGLRSEVVPHDVNQSLNAWCDEMAPQPKSPKKRSRPIKIGIDIGGVLTKYPEIVVPLMTALGGHPAFEVHVLTDMPREKAVEMLVANGVRLDSKRLHACDYATHGERCKAVKAAALCLSYWLAALDLRRERVARISARTSVRSWGWSLAQRSSVYWSQFWSWPLAVWLMVGLGGWVCGQPARRAGLQGGLFGAFVG
jgi:hypothetical protein